ncbi:m-hydroxybenzyl alcohol hydroxylase [Penicillium longicatenatum]|uniref:m-hydroxybenzyl alcohol hydroxylase n=1 Tax=Penicillium longicatenatum TaxID=1561947 RepID=UPI0025472989|nr:m-hydroxybenzyl alcohol hydroxylase [Penicillium longicatenatum]KAJ5661167.1 m-hydroxybenzyl alcohol hydroxylase [Penicillium longicatenatum]
MDFTQSPFLCFAALIAAIGCISSLLRVFLQSGRKSALLPPGPPTVPLFGNELQIPKTDAHFQFMKWAEEYGGIFALKRFKNTTIVISDRKVLKELLDKRSNLYSHRPKSLVSHLITHSDHLLVMQYGDTWRMLRKIIHQYFMEPNCEKEHWKVQEAEANQMLYDFLTKPEDHMLHPKRYSNSITNSLVFGIRSKTVHDDYMEKLFFLMEKWSLVQELGATPPVDDFWLLRKLPQWMTGNWRNRAIEVENLMQSLYLAVVDQVRDRRARGINRDSFMDRVLDRMEKTPLSESQLRFLGGVLMEGGSDTSSSLILTIIQAMTKFPAVQARAHAEIDRVVGSERSPAWSDFANMPYINCIIKEAHRWRPVSPLGVSHAVAQDDYINGMFIPKGATIVLNVWGIHHDPNIYPDPEKFEPSRFESFPSLAPAYTATGEWDKRDHYGYGAGRRICPGIHLAERNLFIGVAKLLWAFEFTQPVGSYSDIDPESGTSQGFLHCPKEYGCGIRLRDPEKRETIEREFREAQERFACFD